METFLLASLTFFFMMFFHELGHIIIAKAYGLRIHRIGIAVRPIPHPFVEVSSIPQKYIKNIFLYGGIAMSIVLIISAWLLGLIHYDGIYYGIVIHFIFEVNPFYSDLTQSFKIIDEKGFEAARQKYLDSSISRGKTIKQSSKQPNLQYIRDHYFDKYRFSLWWYVHFLLWTVIIIYLIAPFGLIMEI